MSKTKYHWSAETVKYFKNMLFTVGDLITHQAITDFVEQDSNIEEDEDEEDLVEDLFNLICE